MNRFSLHIIYQRVGFEFLHLHRPEDGRDNTCEVEKDDTDGDYHAQPTEGHEMLEQLVLGHAMAGIAAYLADVGLNLFHDSPRLFFLTATSAMFQ